MHTRAPRRPSDLVWAIVRLAGAAGILLAVANQLVVTVGNARQSTTPHGSHLPTVVWNFLSFFTIESNLAAAIVLIVAAVWGVRPSNASGTAAEPRWLGILLACAATYMIVTGIVYNVLLRGVALPQGTTVVWANEMLHVVGPLLMLADVLFAPRRRRLSGGVIGIIAAFPIVWAAYTLIRANLIVSPLTGERGWYPYPFLNPALVPGGYLGVAGYIAGIAVAIIAVGTGVIWASRRRGT